MRAALVACAVWALVAQAYIRLAINCDRAISEKDAEIALLTRALVNSPGAVLISASAYTASVDECDGDPSTGAMGIKVVPGRTLAVSRELYPRLKGKTVWLEGVGFRVVEDRMDDRWRGKCDVLVSNKSAARKFGLRRGLRMVVVGGAT